MGLSESVQLVPSPRGRRLPHSARRTLARVIIFYDDGSSDSWIPANRPLKLERGDEATKFRSPTEGLLNNKDNQAHAVEPSPRVVWLPLPSRGFLKLSRRSCAMSQREHGTRTPIPTKRTSVC